jgi:CHAT domain-containing protein/tetratricopeptide (TPR) repeat protein
MQRSNANSRPWRYAGLTATDIDGTVSRVYCAQPRPVSAWLQHWNKYKIAGSAGRNRVCMMVERRILRRSLWIVLLLALGTAGIAASQENPGQESQRLHEQALKLYDAGKYQDGIPIEARALAIRENALGATHPLVGDSLENLGNLYSAAGDYAQAESAYQRGLAIRQLQSSSGYQDAVKLLIKLADLYRNTAAYSKAEAVYRRALAICEKDLGPEHAYTASSLYGIASLLATKGDYDQAEPLYQRALAIRERVLGAEHLDTARALGGLANMYRDRGSYAQAIPLYQRAVAIREKVQGAEHPGTAQVLNALAALFKNTGAYAEAELMHKRALAIREKTFGPEHMETAHSLSGLADLYSITGAYARAESMYRRAISIQEKAPNADRTNLAFSLNNFAEMYCDMGRYEQAEPLLRRAVAIADESLGPEHYYTAAMLGSLAKVYAHTGTYAQAKPLLRRAIAINERALGRDHAHTADLVDSLADLYFDAGSHQQALALYQRTLAIYEKALGPEHPYTAGALGKLGTVHWARGAWQPALSMLRRAQRVRARNAQRFLSSGSELRKQGYLQSLAEETYRNVSFSVVRPGDEATMLGLSSVLQYKGRVLDEVSDGVARIRRSVEPADRVLLEQLAQIASQLSVMTYRGSGNLSSQQYRERVAQLATRQEELEAELAGRSIEFRRQSRPVTVATVSRAIPPNAVLVEWFRYSPFDPTRKTLEARWGAPRYVAYVLKRSGHPVAIDIGSAQVVETLVKDFRAALSDAARHDVKERAAALSDRILGPLRSHLLGAEQLLMSPDGALNLVPMAALLDSRGEYLAQHFEVSYLTSGRDLLRIAAEPQSNGDTIVIAAPDYGRPAGPFASSDPLTRPQRSSDLDRGGLIFRPLFYTGLEARGVQSLLELDDASVLLGVQATEANLKRLRSPHILHIASHGFFLSDQQFSQKLGKRFADASIPESLGENPLLRSGIALAGANERRSGENEDGILTALEATQLDLHGTELVVLSACDSGVGEVQNGEGVYGLRRALTLAGAQTQVISLWKVSDQATRTLVVDYYRRLVKGAGRSAALHQAQRAMLRDPVLSHPYYWASLVPIGNWNPLPARHGRVQP